MLSLTTVFSNTVLQASTLLRDPILNILTTKEKYGLGGMIEVSTVATEVIKLQHINVSNQHYALYLTCFVSILSQFFKKCSEMANSIHSGINLKKTQIE